MYFTSNYISIKLWTLLLDYIKVNLFDIGRCECVKNNELHIIFFI